MAELQAQPKKLQLSEYSCKAIQVVENNKLIVPALPLLYSMQLIPVFTMYLSCYEARFSWGELISSGIASALIHSVALQTRALPTYPMRRRASRKTQYVLDRWMHLDIPKTWFKLPSPTRLSPARFLATLRVHVLNIPNPRPLRSPELNGPRLQLLLQRTRAAPTVFPTFGRLYTNHVRVANAASLGLLAEAATIDTQTKGFYDIASIRFLPGLWDVRYIPEPAEILDDIEKQLRKWRTAV